MSKPKEPLFFEKEFKKGLAYYKKQYFADHTNEAFLGEARHRNLYLPYVPERIAGILPDAKLIIILRNPVERAYSHYIHRRNRDMDCLKFKDAIRENLKRIQNGILFNNQYDIDQYLKQLSSDGASLEYRTYLDCGYYAEQIERYLNYFNKKQILIIFLEDLAKDPKKTYYSILQFLQKDIDLIDIDFKKINERTNRLNIKISRVMKEYPNIKALIPIRAKQIFYRITNIFTWQKNELDSEMRTWLISHYREHNKKLERLTGKDLSHYYH
jgi:hypothetical protein